MSDPRRNLQSYKKKREALKRQTRKHAWPCALCGQPFDWSLPYYHGMAWTADHVVPLHEGGHITGVLRPAHRSCNSKRNGSQRGDRMPTTRAW